MPLLTARARARTSSSGCPTGAAKAVLHQASAHYTEENLTKGNDIIVLLCAL